MFHLRHDRPGRRLAAVVSAAGLVLLAACSWSVPADPGLNSQRAFAAAGYAQLAPEATAAVAQAPAPVYATPARRPAPAAPVQSSRAAQLYYSRCGRCHEPFAPKDFSPGEWPRWVQRYGPRAGLFGQDRQHVLAWLQSLSR